MAQQRRRPTSREAARFRAQNQAVPTYVYVDLSAGTVTGTDGGSPVSCDSGGSSSGGYDSGSSSSSSSYDSGGSSYSSSSYDGGSSSSSCDSGGGF